MANQKLTFGKIKNYWEKRLPQTWYSKERPFTTKWAYDIHYKRYCLYYPQLYDSAELSPYHGKVLEVGVGIGTDLVQYALSENKVYGIDLTEKAIKDTNRHFAEYNLYPEYLGVGNAEEIPFSDNEFDLVYSFGVIHHTIDSRKALEEIMRVTKGRAIIMVYAMGWKTILKRLLWKGVFCGHLFKYGYQGTLNKNTEVHGNSPMTRIFTRRGVKKLTKGFKVTYCKRERLGEYFDYAPYGTWKFPRLVTSLAYLLRLDKLIGENWIIKLEK